MSPLTYFKQYTRILDKNESSVNLFCHPYHCGCLFPPQSKAKIKR